MSKGRREKHETAFDDAFLVVTVTITAIDASVPSVTVKTEDGRTMSFKVADKKNLEGLKVGDQVDITYTAALMIAVK